MQVDFARDLEAFTGVAGSVTRIAAMIPMTRLRHSSIVPTVEKKLKAAW